MKTAVIDLLNKRYAWRAISPEPVEEEKLEAILNAAQLSASCMNKQSWRFMVLTEPEALAKGREAVAPGNYWAKEAPVLLFGFSKPDLDCAMPDGREYHGFSLGLAAQNIMLQATELDLVARPMAGFMPKKVHEAFGIPDEYTVLVCIAIGYKGELETLNKGHQETSTAPRTRQPLEKNFFRNQFKEEN